MTNELFEKIENLIESGHSAEARQQLQKLVISKIPRNRLGPAAELCRRSGLPELALKFLKPVVRSQNPLIQATATEIAQYGQSLVSLGGSEEAIRLLNKPEVIEKEVKALLYLSFAYFAQWDYPSAIPHLENYLSRVDPNSYTHSVGQVNYAAALIAVESYDRAEKTLRPLIESFDSKSHRILSGNCRELLAQIQYHKENLDEAEVLLEEATQLLGGKQPDTLFVQKWQTLIQIKKEGWTKENQNKVKEFRSRAREKLHWETLRDLDFQLSQILNDQNLFNQAYFGTPYLKLREKMKRLCHPLLVKETFIRNINDSSQLNLFVDVHQLDRGNQAIFKTGSLYHRLFLELTKDFYRPQRLPTLFSQLYPFEYYDPEYSNQKVKMLISRLRKILEPLRLEIHEIEGTGYCVGSQKSLGLVYRDSLVALPQKSMDSKLLRLQEQWNDQSFNSQQVADLFKISPRSASRWLKEMVEQGLILRIGDKKGARYQFPRHAA